MVDELGKQIFASAVTTRIDYLEIMKRDAGARRLADEITSKLNALPSRTTPAVRFLRREYSRLLVSATPELVIQIAIRLARHSDSSFRFFAYEIVQFHKAAFSSLTIAQLLQLGEGIDSWSAVDCFACILSGPVWRDGRLSGTLVHDWACSADHWWRRTALVSTVALSRRGTAQDIRAAIEICTLAVSDRHDMVVKALSWALREIAKKHPGQAGKFLARHRAGLAARVIREVQNKIATGLKNP